MIFPKLENFLPFFLFSSFPPNIEGELLSYSSIYHFFYDLAELLHSHRFEMVKSLHTPPVYHIQVPSSHLVLLVNNKYFLVGIIFHGRERAHQFKRMNQMNHSLRVMCDGNGLFYFLNFSYKLQHVFPFSHFSHFPQFCSKFDKIHVNRNLRGKTYPFATSKELPKMGGGGLPTWLCKVQKSSLRFCLFLWKFFFSLQVFVVVETIQIVLNCI